ncbi:MAG: Hsp20 family protein [Candidatus Altiarchaeales archaeon]|nr:Hsp20 family protein [Candidatus Altiarchaeales archaeon]
MNSLSLIPRTLTSASLFDEVDRMFDRTWDRRPTVYAPKVDVIEGESAYTVQADLPGLNKKDIKVDVKDSILTISGERKSEHKGGRENYTYLERSVGTFQRSFKLPDTVDASSIKAKYEGGVLSVALKKREETKPKQIHIE